MATTKAKDGTHLKEKSSSPSSIPTSHGRRSSNPPVSPDRRLPKLPEKPTPHYLKPKATPSADTPRSTKIPQPTPSTSLSKRLPVRKPIEKPPSPSRQPQRTLSLPATHREIPPKPPSPVPRPSISPRPNLDKTPKVMKSGRTSPLTRAKSLVKRREVITTSTASIASSSSPDIAEVLVIKPHEEEEQEEKELLGHIDALKPEDEQDPTVVSPVQDQVESLEQQNNTEEASDDPTPQPEEKQLEVITVDDGVVYEERDKSDKAAETEERVESMLDNEGLKEPVPEPREEAEQVKIKVAPPKSVVGRKKETQRSNEVIEEAKSKFLEKRKSKVLALVGAFETVMALQEPEGQQSQQQVKAGEAEEESSATKESTESTSRSETKESTSQPRGDGSVD